MWDEKAAIQKLTKPIENHEVTDYKCFIAERKSENHSQYKAVIALIVPITKAETILKEIMKFTPEFEFKSSQVETSDERGVDILFFETILNYKEDEDD